MKVSSWFTVFQHLILCFIWNNPTLFYSCNHIYTFNYSCFVTSYHFEYENQYHSIDEFRCPRIETKIEDLTLQNFHKLFNNMYFHLNKICKWNDLYSKSTCIFPSVRLIFKFLFCCSLLLNSIPLLQVLILKFSLVLLESILPFKLILNSPVFDDWRIPESLYKFLMR